MSGLAGVFWRDGRPAAVDDAVRLLVQLAHRRGNPAAIVSGSCAMGCLEEEPVDASPVLTMLDGRLDNRDELLRALDLPKELSDRGVVAAAWQRWGRDCPEHLIGDFAFTVFDGERLFAARDPAPFRPFFYRPTPQRFSWASEISPLVRHDLPPINEGMVAEHLADRLTTLNETLFDGVFRLPPAHAMELRGDGQLRVWRYWSPDPRAEIRYADQRDYDEHFRALLRESVRDCLRASGPIALWYSGGVDSSAIASQMAALRDENDPSISHQLETVSISVPGYPEDETPFFTRGAAHFNLANTARPFYFGTAAEYQDDACAALDIPIVPNMLSAKPVWQVLIDRQVRVSLTGLGGDDWFMGSQFAVFDDVRRWRWRSAFNRLRTDRHLQLGFSSSQLLRLGLWLHLPAIAQTMVRRTLGWTGIPRHVSHALATRVGLSDRLRARHSAPAYTTFAQKDLYDSVMGASVVTGRELQARVAARWRVETRHPFEDRRLAEFALALPADQLLRPGIPRHIVLSALADRLPRAIVSRLEGIDASSVVGDAVLRVGGRERLDTVLKELPDWLDGRELREMMRNLEGADRSRRGHLGREIWAIWQAYSIHFWWRALQQSTVPD